MDITNRAGTITYHIDPLDLVKLSGYRGWWYCRFNPNHSQWVQIARTKENLGVIHKSYELHRLNFCDSVKEIKPSLEKEAL